MMFFLRMLLKVSKSQKNPFLSLIPQKKNPIFFQNSALAFKNWLNQILIRGYI